MTGSNRLSYCVPFSRLQVSLEFPISVIGKSSALNTGMLLGLGLNVLLAPLASDLSFAVEDLNEENPGLFQSAGAYAQAYSMFNSGLAAGMMAGPPFASFIYTRTNWAIMNFVLAAICLLGRVPVVCPNIFFLRNPPFASLGSY